MTRKDYVRFAAMLLDERLWIEDKPPTKDYVIDSIVDRMAAIFATDNPRFDRARFLKACGVES